jgi:hypothetical protein
MHTLNHLKNFEDLRIENEKIFRLRYVYNHDMNAYINYYDSDQWSEEQEVEKDFDIDGHTEIHTFTNKQDSFENFSGASERIVSPPTVVSPKENCFNMTKPLSPNNFNSNGLIRLNQIEH